MNMQKLSESGNGALHYFIKIMILKKFTCGMSNEFQWSVNHSNAERSWAE